MSNRVDTICPWCFEIQDTGVIRKLHRCNEYAEQDGSHGWIPIESSGHETCKNCNKEFIWQLTTSVVAQVSRLDWSVPESATEAPPKVVGLMPYELEEKDK